MRIILFALLLLPSLLFSSIGKITISSGDVSILRAGKSIKAPSNTPLEEKDQVITKTGSAQLRFDDGTTISVGNKTTFKVEEFMFDEAGSKGNAKFGVSEGAFKAITGKIGKINPDKFKLETKTATIGIRGTRFLGIVPKEGPETIACTYGKIYLVLKPVEVKAPTGGASSSTASTGSKASTGQSSSESKQESTTTTTTTKTETKADSTATTPSPKAEPAPQSTPAPAPIGTPEAQAPTPSAPAPAPQPVEVKAGEMTTVSVGKIEAPKAYSPSDINKLEKASSTTESKKTDSSTTSNSTTTASSDNKSDKGSGGDNGGGDKTSSSSTSSTSDTKTTDTKTESTSSTSTASTTSTTNTTTTASATPTPVVNTPTVDTGAISNTVNNAQNTANNVATAVNNANQNSAINNAAYTTETIMTALSSASIGDTASITLNGTATTLTASKFVLDPVNTALSFNFWLSNNGETMFVNYQTVSGAIGGYYNADGTYIPSPNTISNVPA